MGLRAIKYSQLHIMVIIFSFLHIILPFAIEIHVSLPLINDRKRAKPTWFCPFLRNVE
jgi:hypothetical protein